MSGETPTPRTDSARSKCRSLDDLFGCQPLERLARQLERELAAANAARIAAEAELHSIDATLGNRSVFDDCKTRTEKVSLAVRVAARLDPNGHTAKALAAQGAEGGSTAREK